MIRGVARALAGLVIAAGLVLLPTVSASAATMGAPCPDGGTRGTRNCAISADVNSDTQTSNYTTNPNLPLFRWVTDTAIFHDRFDSFPANQLTEKMMRGTVQTLGMAFSNTVWWVTSTMVNGAGTFEVLKGQLGYQVDKIAGSIGQNLISPTGTGQRMLLVAIVVGVIILILFRAWRTRHAGGGAVWKKFTPVVVILALIAGMSWAATSSTAGDMSADGVYHPNPGSPVWVATVVSDSISTVANLPLAAMNTWDVSGSDAANDKEPYSCTNYVNELARRAALGTTTTDATARAATNNISSFWTQTQLTTWKVAQFGGDNDYADFMFCRALEMTSISSSPGQTSAISWAAANPGQAGRVPTVNSTDPSPFTYANNDDFDRTMIAWAACRPNAAATDFTVASGWATKSDGSPWITPAACLKWWGSKANDSGSSDLFNVGGSLNDIRSITNNSQVINFVSALHGSDLGMVTQGTIAIYASASASVTNMLVFGGLSLAVIIAKIYALIMMALLFVLLILAMFSAGSAVERLMPAAQKFLGATIFAAGFALLLSLIALFTKLLIGVGEALNVGGPGNPVQLIWAGWSPIIAVIAIHLIFKKGLKLPSPMSPAGMFAWSAAGGAAGGAIGTSLASRVGRAAKSVGGRAMKTGTDNLLGKATGGRLGTRKNEMGGGPKGAVDQATQSDKQTKVEAIATKKAAKQAHKDELLAAREWRRERDGLPPLEAKPALGTRVRSSIVAGGAGVGSRAVFAKRAITNTASTAKFLGATARTPEGRDTIRDVARERLQHAKTVAHAAIATPEARAQTRTAMRVGVGNAMLATGNAMTTNTGRKATTAAAVAGAVMLGPVGTVAAAGYGAVKLKQRANSKRAANASLVDSYRRSLAATTAKDENRGETIKPAVGPATAASTEPKKRD